MTKPTTVGGTLSDEERSAIRAAVLALEPMTDDQIAAVAEVILHQRTKRLQR